MHRVPLLSVYPGASPAGYGAAPAGYGTAPTGYGAPVGVPGYPAPGPGGYPQPARGPAGPGYPSAPGVSLLSVCVSVCVCIRGVLRVVRLGRV